MRVCQRTSALGVGGGVASPGFSGDRGGLSSPPEVAELFSRMESPLRDQWCVYVSRTRHTEQRIIHRARNVNLHCVRLDYIAYAKAVRARAMATRKISMRNPHRKASMNMDFQDSKRVAL